MADQMLLLLESVGAVVALPIPLLKLLLLLLLLLSM